jgi:hypothetical protein
MTKLPERTTGSDEPYQLSPFFASGGETGAEAVDFRLWSQDSLGQMAGSPTPFCEFALAKGNFAEMACPSACGGSVRGCGLGWRSQKPVGPAGKSLPDSSDRTGQQGQFRQALDAFIGMHELAMSADHLLGCQRDLLDRPAILVHGFHRSGFQASGVASSQGVV